MKLVKKLLRLLPFIYIIVCFFVCAFSLNYNVEYTTNTDIYSSNVAQLVSEFSGYIQTLIGSFGFDYGGDFYIFDPIYDFFGENLGIYGKSFYIVIEILAYELFLSLLFLMFDVFNFMIGIANKWIKKGGNLDD